MNPLVSVASLQDQYQYEIGVHIEKKEFLHNATKKKFYRARWKNEDTSPIVLIEIEGDDGLEEILLNISLDHPHIVKTYGLVRPTENMRNRSALLVLQEYSKDGNLGELIFQKRFIPDQRVSIGICAQVSDAMAYLAEKNIVHGDLQSRNLLMFQTDPKDPKKNLVKLIDFGLTRSDSQISSESCIYPIRFAAPEIIRSKGRSGYTEKSDVFAFAVVVWDIFSKAVIPFGEIDNDETVAILKLDGLLLERPGKCPDTIWSLLLKCWSMKPEHRPDFRTIRTQLSSCQHVHNAKFRSKADRGHGVHNFDVSDESISIASFSSSDGDSIRPRTRSAKNDGALRNRWADNADRRFESSMPSGLNRNPSRHEPVRIPEQNRPQLVPTNRKGSAYSNSIVRTENTTTATVEIPCGICQKPFKASELLTHQNLCLAEDKKRLERKRRQTETAKTVETGPCNYCQRQISVHDIQNHERTCPQNPENVLDIEDNSILNRSISMPNLRADHSVNRKTNAPIATSKARDTAVETSPKKKPSWFRRILMTFGVGKS